MKPIAIICLTLLAIFTEKYSVRLYELQNQRRKTEVAAEFLKTMYGPALRIHPNIRDLEDSTNDEENIKR